MVKSESRVRRYGRVTLVECVVENDGATPRRVRIESALDGPVWPPRTRGLPEAEWDGGRLSVTLAPDERRSVGFATPGEPADPPVSVESEPIETDGGAIAPADVVRTLGDPRPPRAALPSPPPSGPGTGSDPGGNVEQDPAGRDPGGVEDDGDGGNGDGTSARAVDATELDPATLRVIARVTADLAARAGDRERSESEGSESGKDGSSGGDPGREVPGGGTPG